MPSKIFVKGARENNLKNIDVEIPRDALTVITGLSGSGKSSLAFDTIYAEGQRRYVESAVVLRAHVPWAEGKARRRLYRGPFPRHFHRPEDHLAEPTIHRRHGDGGVRLSAPALGARRHAALPELRQGDPPAVHRPDHRSAAWRCGEGTRVQIMAPVVRGKKGEHVKMFRGRAPSSGYVRVRADGNMYDLSEEICPRQRTKSTISRSSSTA